MPPDSEAPSRPRVRVFVGHDVLREVQVLALGVDVVRAYVTNLVDQPPPRCVQVPRDHQVIARCRGVHNQIPICWRRRDGLIE